MVINFGGGWVVICADIERNLHSGRGVVLRWTYRVYQKCPDTSFCTESTSAHLFVEVGMENDDKSSAVLLNYIHCLAV